MSRGRPSTSTNSARWSSDSRSSNSLASQAWRSAYGLPRLKIVADTKTFVSTTVLGLRLRSLILLLANLLDHFRDEGKLLVRVFVRVALADSFSGPPITFHQALSLEFELFAGVRLDRRRRPIG